MPRKSTVLGGGLIAASILIFAFNFWTVSGTAKELRRAIKTPLSTNTKTDASCDHGHFDEHQLEKKYWELLKSFTDGDDVEQSSAKFKDYPSRSQKWELPTSLQLTPSGSCSTTEIFPYGSEEDTACKEYLSNFANWKSIQTLPSVLSIARTIKFIVTFIDGKKAILKVPQKKFLFEPYSECISEEADRLLEFNKVPVTILVPVPVSWLRSVASLNDGFYTYWIENFVFDFTAVKRNIATGRCPFPKVRTIMSSVQLWMDGVKVLHETSYRPKSAMKKLHSSQVVEESERRALTELSNLMVFDYIISNSDRSEKNTFAITTEEETSIILIDQGSSFYSRDPPRGHPLRHTAKHNTSICVFAEKTVETLKNYSEKKLFEEMMKKRLHSADGFWKPWQLKSAQQRIKSLLGIIKYCESTFPKAVRL